MNMGFSIVDTPIGIGGCVWSLNTGQIALYCGTHILSGGHNLSLPDSRFSIPDSLMQNIPG